MPIHSDAIGQLLSPRTTTVTVRDLLAYAAGIGDTSAAVFDDAGDGLIAPPQFCVSLEWPVISDPDLRTVLGASPEELRRGVHAGQDSLFHRAIRAGDRLTTSGRYVAIRPTRAGALLLSRLDTVDERSGAPVVTSWSSSIFRGVEVTGPRRSDESPPALPATAGLAAGSEVEIPISREFPHLYTECARIWNPIHTERRVALAAGLPDIILHGTATWALAGREIIRGHGGGDPTTLLRLAGRFTGMVMPGTSIVVAHSVTAQGLVSFEVRNRSGERAISHGVAVFSPQAPTGDSLEGSVTRTRSSRRSGGRDTPGGARRAAAASPRSATPAWS